MAFRYYLPSRDVECQTCHTRKQVSFKQYLLNEGQSIHVGCEKCGAHHLTYTSAKHLTYVTIGHTNEFIRID